MLRLGLALLLCSICAWPASRPWNADDLWEQRSPSDPQISPDGQQVVYVETWNDRSTNASYSSLWLVSLRDREPRRLTEARSHDRSPRWSPDGQRIAWISAGVIQLINLAGGQKTRIDATAVDLAWSPDSRSIAFTSRTPVLVAEPGGAGETILRFASRPQANTTSLSIVAAVAGATPEVLSSATLDAVGAPAWMPDGKSILIASSDGEIYSISPDGHTVRHIIQGGGRKLHPLPSPDGSKIAWMSYEPQPASYTVRKLYVMNADGSRVKTLAGALDRDPSHPHWSADSRTIYFTAEDAGSTHIYASRADSTLRQVTKGVERLDGFSLADNGHAVTVRTSERAVEVVTFTVDLPPQPVVLAAPMESQFAAHLTASPEEIQFPSGAKTVQGWLLKPPGFDPSKSYPLLLDIADAPRCMYGPEFSLQAQVLAAHGWIVLRVNPRGTPGYGEQFGRLLPSAYPGDDADDLMAAVEFVLGKGFVDAQRIAVRGGLLAVWLVGHTLRFHTAIARHAVVNLLTAFEQFPWLNTDQMVTHSPHAFAAQWMTPMLVLASPNDPQADQLYAILRQRRLVSSLVRLSDDSPATQVREVEATLAWLK